MQQPKKGLELGELKYMLHHHVSVLFSPMVMIVYKFLSLVLLISPRLFFSRK